MRPRVMFYSQHVLGMGHLVRSLEIIRGLAEFEVCFVNGGELVAGFAPPPAVKVVNLPPLLAGAGVMLPSELPHVESVHHLFVIRVKGRDELLKHLRDRGIDAGVHYPVPIHRQVAMGRRCVIPQPMPCADAKGLLKAAIRNPNPVVFLEHELLYGDTMDVPKVDDWVLPIGKAKVARAGTDVTIVSYSRGVKFALEAAGKLEAEGVSAEVIDLRTLRPMDTATVIESVKKTNRIVTVEEGWAPCGVGAEIGWQVTHHAFDWLDAPPARVTQEDVPLPYAANLEALSLPNADKIIRAVKAVMYRD